MGTSTHHHSNEFTTMLFFLAILVCTQCFVAQATATSPERGAQETGSDWQRYAGEARQNLKKASECMEADSSEHRCRDFLDAAASNYRAMGAMLKDSDQNVERVVEVADGLRRAGRATDAVDLLRRYEAKGDANLVHLLADILYAMSDYHNAAIAYRKWISAGCAGYLLSLDDHGLWAKPIKARPCASLPAELRARLEDLQDIAHGEPSNLPRQGQTAMRITSH